MYQTRVSGCVNDEPCGTVLHSLFHGPCGPRDELVSRRILFGNYGFLPFRTIELDQTSLSCLSAASAERNFVSSPPAGRIWGKLHWTSLP